MYLDVADWQDCTKVPPISLLPQILLLRGMQEDGDKMKDADKGRSEREEMSRESEEGSVCEEEM